MSKYYAMAAAFLLAGSLLTPIIQSSLAGSESFRRVTPVGGPWSHPPAPDTPRRVLSPWPRGQSSQLKPTGETGGRTRQLTDAPLVTITYPTGTRVRAELADTPQKRSRGLMFREKLAPDAGMLFVFEEAGEWSFWMKNTKVALDILWIGPDKRIVYIEENVPLCRQDPCPEYKSSKGALYVLELPSGSVNREKLVKGMKLAFELPK